MESKNHRHLLRGMAALPVAALLAAAGIAVAYASGPDDPDTATTQVTQSVPDNTPTFYGDVLPILAENCIECHSPVGRNIGGMVAPMSFTTYEETRPWAPMIADAIEDERMPPWDAAPEFRGVFLNERWLDDGDRETLIAWVEAGAPEGDPSQSTVTIEVPDEPSEENWSIGEPDLIIGFDQPYYVGDEVEDIQPTVPVRISAEDHPEARWIRRAEILPGSHAVHHVLAWPIAAVAHGVPPVNYSEGHSVLLPAGPQTLTFSMHYNKTPGPGTAIEDVTRAGVVFWEEGTVIEHIVQTDPFGIFDFVIPAGDANYAATGEMHMDEDSYILAFLPHMHLRGKAARFEIAYPDGTKEALLEVPRYDFDWQHKYTFREPVFAPEGSTVTMTLWWDNSENNPHNPDPTRDVYWGTPTTDEMGYGFMDWVHAEPIDYVVGDPIPEDLPPTLSSPLSPSPDDLPPEVQMRIMQEQQRLQREQQEQRQLREDTGSHQH